MDRPLKTSSRAAFQPHKSHSPHQSLPSETIRAITFDVGGTLIECQPSVGHIYAEVAARYGHADLSPALLNKRFKTAWRQLKDFAHTTADWAALVDATFHGLIDAPPSRTFFPELFERFSEPDAWLVFDDVFATLESLQGRKLKLGIVSNWDDRLRPLLRRLKLDCRFNAIIISCEVGARKPSALPFKAACRALGTDPGETLHVGDSLEMDVRGAGAAGLQARWLRRGARQPWRHVIRSLQELDKL